MSRSELFVTVIVACNPEPDKEGGAMNAHDRVTIRASPKYRPDVPQIEFFISFFLAPS